MNSLLSHVVMQLRIGLRDPAYLFTSILLPAGLYWFFAVPESNSAYTAVYLTGSFSAFCFFWNCLSAVRSQHRPRKRILLGPIPNNTTHPLLAKHFSPPYNLYCTRNHSLSFNIRSLKTTHALRFRVWSLHDDGRFTYGGQSTLFTNGIMGRPPL